MNLTTNPFFAPELYFTSGLKNIDFYEKAFDVIELRRWTNDDGSLHVAELSIDGDIFHVHEESARSNKISPEKINGTTVLIGLFVQDVDRVMKKAIQAGATEISAAQDYDYRYRQGEIKDPFGHI